MNTTAIALHLNIAESAIIKTEEWANVLFVVCRRLGARFVSKKVMKNMNDTEIKLFELTISNMPARDKRGWVKQGDTFLRANSQNSHGVSAQRLTFLLADGVYEVQDANYGFSRTRRYWLEVKNGEGQEISKPKANAELKLPELQGSERQISWAESIRDKAIAKLFSVQKPTELEMIKGVLKSYDSVLVQAKWWIENRDSIDKSLQLRLKNLVSQSIKPYPVKIWEDYEEEYAHEGEGGEWVWKIGNQVVFQGQGDELDTLVFCQNSETQEWEIWHYTPSIY
jgi:hypothetical protein